jgi:hypothetical protein
MCALMSLEITLLTEWLITHAAAKWPLPIMYALMSLQLLLLSECLITDFAAILTLLFRVSESIL